MLKTLLLRFNESIQLVYFLPFIAGCTMFKGVWKQDLVDLVSVEKQSVVGSDLILLLYCWKTQKLSWLKCFFIGFDSKEGLTFSS
jgi:hypothetical protein